MGEDLEEVGLGASTRGSRGALDFRGGSEGGSPTGGAVGVALSCGNGGGRSLGSGGGAALTFFGSGGGMLRFGSGGALVFFEGSGGGELAPARDAALGGGFSADGAVIFGTTCGVSDREGGPAEGLAASGGGGASDSGISAASISDSSKPVGPSGFFPWTFGSAGRVTGWGWARTPDGVAERGGLTFGMEGGVPAGLGMGSGRRPGSGTFGRSALGAAAGAGRVSTALCGAGSDC